MANFAVIDTETNWADQVMSIGTVISNGLTFRPLAAKYHVFPTECALGGMYTEALFLNTPVQPVCCARRDAMAQLCAWLEENRVTAIFAYNANFDRSHLPELGAFSWYDIMRIAAYRQYNPRIPATAELCATGRLKRGYGVEPMLRLLRSDRNYRETHNALLDAQDELEIMRLLNRPPEEYIPL